MSNAIVIDGNAVIYRAYYASQALLIKENKTDQEILENIHKTISSVSNMCKSWSSKKDYKYAVVVFDSSRNTFRREKFQNYKSNRASMPVPLFKAMEDIKNSLQNLDFKIVSAPASFEGDDVICALSHIFGDCGIDVDIFSTDKDLLQLVNDKTTVRLISKSGVEPAEYSHKNFSVLTEGLTPSQIPAYKAIAGDHSDNYGGIPGVGFKTAKKLLLEYKTIENIYSNLDDFSPSLKSKFLDHKEQLLLFLEIATTVKEVGISKDIKDYERDKDV